MKHPRPALLFQTLRPLQVFSNDAQKQMVTHFGRRVACSSTFQAWEHAVLTVFIAGETLELDGRGKDSSIYVTLKRVADVKLAGTDFGTRRAITASLADDD